MSGNRVGQIQAVIMRHQSGAVWEILILKRNEAKGGFWQPVTGGIHPGEKPIAAAIREVEEETRIVDFERIVNPHYYFEFTEQGVTLTEHVFGFVVKAGTVPKLSDEHVEERWVSLNVAVEMLKYDSNKASVRHIFETVVG